MLTDNQLTRLADMAQALRPDWPARSVRAYLASKHRDRAYADLGVALAVVALDPGSETPARLDQHGPWWLTTRANVPGGLTSVAHVGPRPGAARCSHPGHEHEEAHACRACRAEQAAGTTPDKHPAPAVPAPDLRALIHATRQTA